MTLGDRNGTSSGPSAHDVELVVRAVMAELFAAAAREEAAQRDRAKPAAPDVFSGRLLSLAQAEALPAQLRSLAVTAGTIVTPLARDYLKKHGIELRFVADTLTHAARNVGEWGFVIEATSGVVESLRRAWLSGADAWNELGNTLDDAVRWVAADQSRGAVVLTDEGAVAVYRACQTPGVRAAAAADVDAVARAVRGLGVNLLVIEPAGKPIALMKQMSTSFRRVGAPIAPESLAMREPRS